MISLHKRPFIYSSLNTFRSRASRKQRADAIDLDPCVLLATKFYKDFDSDGLHVNCNFSPDDETKEPPPPESRTYFNYGDYVIQCQSEKEKEKEIEALGGIQYLSTINAPSPVPPSLSKDKDAVGHEEKNSYSKSKTNPKLKTGWKRYIGILLAFAATMSYSLATLIVKLCDGYHPFTLSFWRFQGKASHVYV